MQEKQFWIYCKIAILEINCGEQNIRRFRDAQQGKQGFQKGTDAWNLGDLITYKELSKRKVKF